MTPSAQERESRTRGALAVGAVVFLGAVHALMHEVHDAAGGAAFLSDFLPSLAIAAHVTLLCAGQVFSVRWHWSRHTTVVLVALLGLGCGLLAVALHGPRLSPAHTLAVAAVVGGATTAFWARWVYRPSKLAEVKARLAAAESQCREAELVRLRSNLHPHFLLNTLNAIAGLVVAQPDDARRLLSALGDLLRDSLDQGSEMTTLGEETEWLRRYAEIFEIRHRGQIRFVWEVAPEVLAARVPRLLIQPLFENAIEHGALRRSSGGTVGLVCRKLDHTVSISVQDDGPGLVSDSVERASGRLGLRLVQDRLKVAYPDATMVIDSDSSGTRVTLELPAEPAS
jgi:signal transduction histidine kinase